MPVSNEITRIDLLATPVNMITGERGQYVKVAKWADGWEAEAYQARPASVDFNGKMSLDQMCEILISQGWKVRRPTPIHARAWKYRLAPVRTRNEIITLRQRLMRQFRSGLLKTDPTGLDLAFDL